MKNKKEIKKKEKSEKKEKRKIDFSDIEEKIKRLEAEKEIEQTSESEEHFFEPVRQIPISSETRAPILERIIQREAPEQNFVQTAQGRGEEREEKRIDYSVQNQPNYGFERRTDEDEEKKYESTFVAPVLSRRGELSAVSPELLRQQTETWTPAKGNSNEMINSEFIESETRLPFEEQKKYKRFKLR